MNRTDPYFGEFAESRILARSNSNVVFVDTSKPIFMVAAFDRYGTMISSRVGNDKDAAIENVISMTRNCTVRILVSEFNQEVQTVKNYTVNPITK